MSQSVQELLKVINYIETDLEIQKQILFSIPSDQKAEMEKVILTIKEKKERIEALRQEIKKIDPDVFDSIIAFEKATMAFKKLNETRTFKTIETLQPGQECTLVLKDNRAPLECLVKAQDENGDWAVVTMDGETLEFSQKEVVSENP